MHYTLGVYAPLTFMSAIKAGVSESQAISLIQKASSYMDPMTWILVILGYLTGIVLIVGILIGKIGLKKRVLLYMYAGYALVVCIFTVIGKITGESGLTGSLESLLETTFFIPAFLYYDPASKLRKKVR